jgi:hypothetical protein
MVPVAEMVSEEHHLRGRLRGSAVTDNHDVVQDTNNLIQDTDRLLAAHGRVAAEHA